MVSCKRQKKNNKEIHWLRTSKSPGAVSSASGIAGSRGLNVSIRFLTFF